MCFHLPYVSFRKALNAMASPATFTSNKIVEFKKCEATYMKIEDNKTLTTIKQILVSSGLMENTD